MKWFDAFGSACSSVFDASCKARRVEIQFADRSSVLSYNSGTGPASFEWDGLDSSGNRPIGSVPLKFSFTDVPAYTNEVPIEYSETIGSLNAAMLGLGGWTLSPVHFYDANMKTVFRGDGSAFKANAKILSGPSYQVTSEDGSEVYLFDATGRITLTKTGLKGAVKYTFGYSSGKLVSITDAYSNITSVTYTSGLPSSIVSPYGATTTLTVDGNGYLSTITNPSYETYTVSYYSGSQSGLLYTFQKPKGVVSTMYYGTYGDLMYDVNSAGGTVSLGTFGNSTEVVSPEGVSVLYNSNPVPGTIRSTTGPDAIYSQEQPTFGGTGLVQAISRQLPDGATYNENKGADPRDPATNYTNSYTYNTSNYSLNLQQNRSATLTDSENMFSVVSTNTSFVLNWAKTTNVAYSSSTSKFTVTTPVGRKTYLTIDSNERPVSLQQATFTPITTTYDSSGRVSQISQGLSRNTSLAYNSAGQLHTVTNALSHVTTFSYDASGRLTQQILPDTRVIGYSYDDNGNLASLTAPGGATHAFVSNGFDLIERYTAPAIAFLGLAKPAARARAATVRWYNSSLQWIGDFFKGILPSIAKRVTALTVNLQTEFEYNLDRKLTLITRPDGQSVTFNYSNTSGRLASISVPGGSYTISPNVYYDRLNSVTSPDGVAQAYTMDGSFLMSTINSGASAVAVYFTYNSDFVLASTKINTATPISYGYDNDLLLTSAGSETVARSSATGLPTKSEVGSAEENYSYSGVYGELASIQGKYSTSTNIYHEVLTRDDLARVVSKTETVASGSADVYGYTFDTAGRLTAVVKNSAAYASYAYDSNSNRTSVTRGSTTTNATFDTQDRIVTFGTKTYTHNDAGELTHVSDSATTPASVTSYTYDVFGNMKSATLPSGTTISYLLDGQNRRVGRKVAGVMDKQFVWFDQLRPAAELSSTGVLVSQFIYAVKPNVPDYIIKGGVNYKVMTDHLGSIVAVVNSATGAIAQAISYDEFGRVLTDTAPGFQPFGFAGGLYDPDTKLTLFGARTYDAETGRWLSKDPILFNGHDANLYGYALNDPINRIDPTGTVAPLIGGAIAIGGSALIGGVIGGVGTAMQGGSARAIGRGFMTGFIGGGAGALGMFTGAGAVASIGLGFGSAVLFNTEMFDGQGMSDYVNGLRAGLGGTSTSCPAPGD